MTTNKLFNTLVNSFIGSWCAGVNAYVDQIINISYGKQLVIKSLEEDNYSSCQVNVYHSKKGVRIVIQGKETELLELVEINVPAGLVTESVLQSHSPIYVWDHN